MTDDKFDRIGPMLAAIGQKAAELVDDPEGLYVYAEIGDRWMSLSIFHDEGEVVRCIGMERVLDDLVLAAWEAEDPDKRWSVMEYEIKGGKFHVSFRFPDEVDVEDWDVDRREIALKRRYGDKPVVYPPIPGKSFELKQ